MCFILDPPPYAILSHRWGLAADEVSFEDFKGDLTLARQKKGYRKVEGCCIQALKDKLNYAWIDSCCIDKSSSAELSEAINSMYGWYGAAQVCYAYLEDITTEQDPRAPDSAFRQSPWFTRGWTLQELISPKDVRIFSGRWTHIGDKTTLADLIEEITNVSKDILLDRNMLHSACVAQKMSWASRRQTTRLEDEAYSLIGLFGINMPTIYGEGSRAFIRLQEEIIRVSSDHSIFAWDGTNELSGMLATSPKQFANSAEYRAMEYVDYASRFCITEKTAWVGDGPIRGDVINLGGVQPNYAMTNFGLQIQLPTFQIYRIRECCFACLACTHGEDGKSVVISLYRRPGRPSDHFYRTLFNDRNTHPISRDDRLDFHTGLSYISGNEPQSQLDILTTPEIPSKSSVYRLHVKSEQLDGDATIKITDCHPPEAVTWENRECLATVRSGKHVVLTFEPVSSSDPLEMLDFAFGVINGNVWYSARKREIEGTAEKLHRSYDPFRHRGLWEYFLIHFVDDDEEKELDASHTVKMFAVRLEQKDKEFTLTVRSHKPD